MTIFCNNLAICNHEPYVHYIFVIDEVLYKIVLVEIEGRIVFKDNQIVVAVATESVVFQIFMDGVETLESCIEVYLAVGLDSWKYAWRIASGIDTDEKSEPSITMFSSQIELNGCMPRWKLPYGLCAIHTGLFLM